MPQVIWARSPLLDDQGLLDDRVGSGLVEGHWLWWELAAAEEGGTRQRKEGGSWLEAVSAEHFCGILHTLWACWKILALAGCTCGVRTARDMVACWMKPKLMCQATFGAESGGTMAATMSAATATLCCTTTAVNAATAC